MIEFGSNTGALLDIEYKENKRFSKFTVTNNDISSMKWDGLVLSDVVFEKNNMQRITMRNGSCYNTNFVMSDISNSNFAYSFFENVSFDQCSLVKGNLSFSHIYKCLINNCSAESINMCHCRIVKTQFCTSELYKLNCENSIVINSEFTVDMDKNFWGLQKAIFSKSLIVGSVFRGIEYEPDVFSGSILVNCRFDN
ncbi:MAG: hypothetical protein FWG49_00145 [Leptospirales bacterium]|nr:hypothetical protein [Leptospirales bacterium]